MGPRANFTCLAKACATETGASVYELPVAATRCPVCGSKRIRRLFDAVNIGSAQHRAAEKIIQSSSLPAQAEAAKVKPETPTVKVAGSPALGAVRAAPGAAAGSHQAVALLRSGGGLKPEWYRG
jgi:hypothetical protein